VSNSLAIAAQVLAESRHRAHPTDLDRAWAQELERRLRAAGWVYAQAPEFTGLGPGAPTGLHMVKETGT
jgi:hypothetical protein